MAPTSTFREADLPTSWSEERARTLDAAPPARPGPAQAGPAPGDILKNRFVLQACLADGPHSRLFLARDRRRETAGDADARVALKLVTAEPGRESRALQALRREAAIAQGLTHPNLPRIIGLDRDGPHTFLCMEWLEGESLATILDSRGARPMTRVQALHIVDGVCRALAHMHGQGITHADVKPGNILVTPEGNATLLDFGVALGPGAADLPAVRGHTPEYASPQVLAGAEPTPADDLFSVACVAYRMLSGQRAFGVGNARDAETAGLRPPPPGNLSPAQWRALDRALAFGRAARQPDVTTFLAQLKGARDESAAVTDLSGGEPGIVVLPAGAARRDVLRFWPVAAILAGVLAAGVAYLSRQTDDRPPPAAGTLPAAPPTAEPTSATAAQAAIARAVDPPRPQAQVLPAESPGRRPEPAAPRAADVASPAGTKGPIAAATKQARSAAERRDARRPTAAQARDPAAAPGGRADAAEPAQSTAETPPTGADGGLPDTAGTARRVPFSSLAVRRYVEPEFPRKAAARRLSGWVDVTFGVDDSGRTRDVRVIDADPPRVFDDAALDAVRRWRFEPGAAGATGTPVRSGIRLRFDPGKTRGGGR